MPKKNDPLQNILVSIDDTLKKQNSLKRILLQGVVRGFGTALGATVILAIVTSLTLKFVDSFDVGTFMEYMFQDLSID